MTDKKEPLCSQVNWRISSRCCKCSSKIYIEGPVHIVKGVFYCELHCPVHGQSLLADLERGAIQEMSS